MKTTVREYDGCFAVGLAAENMEDAAMLVRMGMNATMEIRSFASSAYQDGKFEASIVFGKNKRSGADIPRRSSSPRRRGSMRG